MSHLPAVSITRWHSSGYLPTRQLAPKPGQGSSRIMELWKWALVFWWVPTQLSVVWDSYSLWGLNIIIKYHRGFIASKLDLVSSCLNRITVVCTWNHVLVHLSLHQHGQRLCCRQRQRQSHRCESRFRLVVRHVFSRRIFFLIHNASRRVFPIFKQYT